MSFWILAGILTALATGLTLAPLAARQPGQKGLPFLVLGVLILALALYFYLGHPDWPV